MRKASEEKEKEKRKEKRSEGRGNLPSLRVSITNHLREMSVSLSLIRVQHHKSEQPMGG